LRWERLSRPPGWSLPCPRRRGGAGDLRAEDRYAELLTRIEELRELNRAVPVVVEGARDVRALRALGLRGRIEAVNTGAAVFALCERLGREVSRVILLTDWDRRGGQLARLLREGFAANGVTSLDGVRARITALCQKDIKDVESLDALVARAERAMAEGSTGKESKRWYSGPRRHRR